MTKKNLFKTVIIVFLLFMLVGLVFFRKNKNGEISKPKPRENWQPEESEKKQELTEEEKAKIMAGNFAVNYYSYVWGDFSNVEFQYCYMTDELKSKEKNKVEKMKEETEGQPQRYFTARAELLDSEIVLFTDTEIKLDIKLNIDNLSCAIVQRDTLVWVDENGDYYKGNPDDLITNSVEKNIEIKMIKIGNEWKVDEIGEK